MRNIESLILLKKNILWDYQKVILTRAELVFYITLTHISYRQTFIPYYCTIILYKCVRFKFYTFCLCIKQSFIFLNIFTTVNTWTIFYGKFAIFLKFYSGKASFRTLMNPVKLLYQLLSLWNLIVHVTFENPSKYLRYNAELYLDICCRCYFLMSKLNHWI